MDPPSLTTARGQGTVACWRWRQRRQVDGRAWQVPQEGPEELWTPVSHNGLGTVACWRRRRLVAAAGGSSGLLKARRDAGNRSKVLEVLRLFHLDNEYLREKVLEDYKKVSRYRPARRGFRKSEAKDRLALAFAMCQQLNRLGAPRCPVPAGCRL